MKLLVITQVVDTDHPVLSFFHVWIEELAKHFESIEVICLEKGKYALPKNVTVHSLGKELGARSRLSYAFTFLSLVFTLRNRYDRVFVHMNQEYILLVGLVWKLFGKRVSLWRNHYEGSFLTDIAAAFCDKVFCTSTSSYTARYRKTVIMPVGVDTRRFSQGEKPIPGSILFLARMAPSKRAELLLEALVLLKEKNIPFTASLVGSPLPKDEAYYESLRSRAQALGIADTVTFTPGPSYEEATAVFQRHEIFVNASRSGMFDKTLFEAAAGGALPIAVSEDWKKLAGDDLAFEADPESLAERLSALLAFPPHEKERIRAHLRGLVESHSLATLVTRLREEV